MWAVLDLAAISFEVKLECSSACMHWCVSFYIQRNTDFRFRQIDCLGNKRIYVHIFGCLKLQA